MGQILYYYFNLDVIWRYLPDMLGGFLVTLSMAALVVVLGIVGGLVLAVLRAFRVRPLNWLMIFIVDAFRAVPPLVIMVFVYFALPYVGLSLSSFAAATLSLTLVLMAFAEEIFWAGITSVDRGQWEAARSTGIGFLGTLVSVILPQAVQLAIPPLTNRAIAITKGTSLASVIAVQEIINRASSAQAQAANPSPLMLGAILYLIIFAPLVRGSRWVEARFGRRR
ncbi:MAG TPA: amino acid ABC transporter permease [Trueperaceae bacterium]|nr:amino acid ABC transporter permease [Trueperaceae bacterium]